MASTPKLIEGDVLKAPRQRRKAWLCIGSRILRYEGLAEPYTIQL